MPIVGYDPAGESEADWIEFMTGFRVLRESEKLSFSAIPDENAPDVFYASAFSVLRHHPGGSEFAWVEVDGPRGMARPLLGVDTKEAPPRSLWFNVTMLCLLLRGGLLVHAAGAAISGRGFLFLGESGIGKSTLSRLLEDFLPGSVICDERLACRPVEGRWTMFGTPWKSTAGISRRLAVPLAGLVFLEQAEENKIRPITTGEALPRMLPLISVDWQNEELSGRGANALDDLLSSVSAFNFAFQKSSAAAEYLAGWAETAEYFLL